MKSLLLRILTIFVIFYIAHSNAVITFEGSSSRSGVFRDVTITAPTGIAVGDVLITQVTIRDSAFGNTIAAPTGWIEIGTQQNDVDVLQSVYYKVATAADISSPSYFWDWFFWRYTIINMQVYRGVSSPPIDVFATNAGMNGRNIRANAVNATNPDEMLIAFYSLEAGNSSFTPNNAMTEIYDLETGSNSGGLTVMSAYQLLTSAGNTGPKNGRATINNDNGVSHTVALNSAAQAPEITALTTNCSNLSEAVIIFSEDLDAATAQDISNYSITNNALTSIGVSSAVLSSSNTVTLTMATAFNDLTPYALTVNNVESTTGSVIAANTTQNFMLQCDLNCITDNFVGPGPLSSSWSVGNSSGSFGDPRIVADGRLRLTDDSGNVSTVATLLNQFPGAENRIEIEFDYYGYDGNGADGIAINFSDASIAPAAGAFGGSLGYAQKTGIDGFAGGWLGVGIDEYGNFSSGGEGRSGGPGRINDSVSLRGSGSGTSGYPYLTGTGTLSPVIDQSGSSPGPMHRYKIVIDHTAGGSVAIVSVERDSGSGYSAIVPSFNIYTENPSQTVVPANWVVSFTGSTGGSTNIHEIGDLKVCAAQPIQTFSQVDHYNISHTTPGLTCEASEVTITAHDINHDPINVLSDTSLTITTTPAVSAVVSSPVTLLTGSSSTSVYLQQGSILANIDIDVTDGTFTDDEGSTEDPRISFLDSAFRFYADGSNTDTTPIATQISGKPSIEAPGVQSLVLRAIQTNTDTQACEAAIAGTRAVNIAYRCTNPDSCSSAQLSFTADETKSVSGTDTAAALSYTAVDMVFGANGNAPFSFNFPDAGKIELHAQLAVAAISPEPAFTLMGMSNEFVVRPFAFDLGFVGNFNAVDANGDQFVKAGVAFPMTIRAVNWQEADDDEVGEADDGLPDLLSNISDNSTALNFGQELNGSDQILTIGHTLVLPTLASGGNAGSLIAANQVKTSNSEEFFTAGITDGTPPVDLTWDEVGIIDIDVSLNNYLLATGGNIQGRQANVGRFYPDHFIMTASSTNNSCVTFSYMGQPGIEIDYTLQAHKFNGGLTQNYKDGFAKAAMTLVAENNNDGVSLQARLVNTSPAVNWVSGEFDYTFSGSFTRLVGNAEGPYSNLQVGVDLDDNDGDVSSLLSLDMNAGESTTCGVVGDCDAKLIGNLGVRFGQLKLSNVFGPETFDLDMAVRTEYFDGTDFILNTDDSCTNLAITDPPFTPSNWTDNLTDGDSTISLDSDITSGVGVIRFDAAGLGNEGSVIFNYSADSWLKTENTGPLSYDDDAVGKVTFGQYRGNDRMIYWREVVR